jgi:hypothetical protein
MSRIVTFLAELTKQLESINPTLAPVVEFDVVRVGTYRFHTLQLQRLCLFRREYGQWGEGHGGLFPLLSARRAGAGILNFAKRVSSCLAVAPNDQQPAVLGSLDVRRVRLHGGLAKGLTLLDG